jgi:hypothetical protein
LKNATVKNRFEFLSQLSKRNLRIKYGFAFALRHCQPTVCVTGGWAGVGKTPRAGFCSGVENARKWRRIPPVKCTLCWHAFVEQDSPPEKNTAAELPKLLHRLLTFTTDENHDFQRPPF